MAGILCLVSPSAAQSVAPYGSATAGSGGIAPRIWVHGEPRLGNLGFLITLDRALGGAPAVLALSDGRARVPIVGAHLLVDPGSPLFAAVGPLIVSGPAGAVGQGSATQSFGIPTAPFLEGFDFYAQWFVADRGSAGGLAASDGVRFTARRDAVLLGVLQTGFESLVPGSGSAVHPWPSVFAFIAHGVALTRDGRTALVGLQNFPSRPRIEFFDVTTQPPTPIPSAIVGGSGGALVHPFADLAYATVASTLSSGIAILDVDRGSPTFGQSVGGIPGVQLPSGPLDISADGTVMLISEFLASYAAIDVEPGSPTRHTVIHTFGRPPGALGLSAPFLAPDGDSYFFQLDDSTIAQFDLLSGRLLAQSAALPGSLVGRAMDPRGRFVVIATDASALTVVDLETGPGFFSLRSIPTESAVRNPVLAGDGSTLLVSARTAYEIYDLASGVRFWSAPSAGTINAFALR